MHIPFFTLDPNKVERLREKLLISHTPLGGKVDDQQVSQISKSIVHVRDQLGVASSPKSVVFLNIVQKGGGSNTCSKILEQILYDFKGLFCNIKLT